MSASVKTMSKARWQNSFVYSLAGLATAAILSLSSTSVLADTEWTSNGNGLTNTRNAALESHIDANNVGNLYIKWDYVIAPDEGLDNSAPFASVTATPAVEGGYVYFTDWSGNITKLNKSDGSFVWSKSFLNDLSAPGYSVNISTNTPLIVGDTLVVGNNYFVQAQLCEVVNQTASPVGCHNGDGAILLGLDKNDGSLKWRIKVDEHPSSKITGSVTAIGNKLIVPVAGWEEDWARTYPNIYEKPIDPTSKYPCCSGRGSVVALELNNQGPPTVLWKTYLAIGDDANKELQGYHRKVLKDEGYWGVSAYGHTPTVDLERNQVLVGTTNTRTAPKLIQLCEQARRLTGDPNADIPNEAAGIKERLPDGLTCNNINEELKTYLGAVVALDLTTGNVNWANFARKYDPWNHTCGEGNFDGLGSIVVSAVYPTPLKNVENCGMDPIGPDYGYGSNPMLIKHPSNSNKDILVVGNKDGRVFGIDPVTGESKWVTRVDPGSIYGGIQFGMATDGQVAYAATMNAHNTNRDKDLALVSSNEFLAINGLDVAMGLRGGLDHKFDGHPGSPKPGPGPLLPFFDPAFVMSAFFGFNVSDYPDFTNFFPEYDVNNLPTGYYSTMITGPRSGPSEKWQLLKQNKIPSDVVIDGKNVFEEDGKVKTINGMLTALDVKTGQILWQRPLNDGLDGEIGPGGSWGNPTVANGVVYLGISDSKGTIAAYDATTGELKFKYHQTVMNNGNEVKSGSNEGGPAVVDGVVYWGLGAGTFGAFPSDNQINFKNRGHRVLALEPCPTGKVPAADLRSCVNE